MLTDDEVAYSDALRDIETGTNSEKAFVTLLDLANNGFVNAMNHVANCYSAGVAVDKNVKEALRWWRKGAAHGDELCMINIATEYRDKLDNRKRAIWWLRKAAKAGSADAYFELAETFYNTDKVKYRQKILSFISDARASGGFLSDSALDMINEMLLHLNHDQR